MINLGFVSNNIYFYVGAFSYILSLNHLPCIDVLFISEFAYRNKPNKLNEPAKLFTVKIPIGTLTYGI